MSAPVGLAVTLDDLVFDPSDTRHYLSASNNGAHKRKYYFPRLEDDNAVPAKVAFCLKLGSYLPKSPSLLID